MQQALVRKQEPVMVNPSLEGIPQCWIWNVSGCSGLNLSLLEVLFLPLLFSVSQPVFAAVLLSVQPEPVLLLAK